MQLQYVIEEKNDVNTFAAQTSMGLEIIEGHYLYEADYDDIEIVIHPQSIIHSMIETQDSSILAQLGWPDMRLPILYTLSWLERIYCSEITWPRLDLCKLGSLTFKNPDNVKYPSVHLAYAVGRAGGTMTRVLSAANEKAVEMFIDEKISYLDIFKVVELTWDQADSESDDEEHECLKADNGITFRLTTIPAK
ncbi:hypothetical protein LguiA_001761 [Lonicera macranthoides]